MVVERALASPAEQQPSASAASSKIFAHAARCVLDDATTPRIVALGAPPCSPPAAQSEEKEVQLADAEPDGSARMQVEIDAPWPIREKESKRSEEPFGTAIRHGPRNAATRSPTSWPCSTAPTVEGRRPGADDPPLSATDAGPEQARMFRSAAAAGSRSRRSSSCSARRTRGGSSSRRTRCTPSRSTTRRATPTTSCRLARSARAAR